MSYYRLRDIKTPPFAYVVNKEQVIESCRVCQMPFQELEATLEVEICANNSEDWATRIKGKPLMADHWLIGDLQFGERLEELLPEAFVQAPVEVCSWMTRGPMAMLLESQKMLEVRENREQPAYFYFKPGRQISLAPRIVASFPPMKCCECKREIPEIPIDFQPIPDPAGDKPIVASLQGLYLEGYDYLFREDVATRIELAFPEMILEKLVLEPMTI